MNGRIYHLMDLGIELDLLEGHFLLPHISNAQTFIYNNMQPGSQMALQDSLPVRQGDTSVGTL